MKKNIPFSKIQKYIYNYGCYYPTTETLIKFGRFKMSAYCLQKINPHIIHRQKRQIFICLCKTGNSKYIKFLPGLLFADRPYSFYIDYFASVEILDFCKNTLSTFKKLGICRRNYSCYKFIRKQKLDVIKYIIANIDKKFFVNNWYEHFVYKSKYRFLCHKSNRFIFDFLEREKIDYNKNGLINFYKNDRRFANLIKYLTTKN